MQRNRREAIGVGADPHSWRDQPGREGCAAATASMPASAAHGAAQPRSRDQSQLAEASEVRFGVCPRSEPLARSAGGSYLPAREKSWLALALSPRFEPAERGACPARTMWRRSRVASPHRRRRRSVGQSGTEPARSQRARDCASTQRDPPHRKKYLWSRRSGGMRGGPRLVTPYEHLYGTILRASRRRQGRSLRVVTRAVNARSASDVRPGASNIGRCPTRSKTTNSACIAAAVSRSLPGSR